MEYLVIERLENPNGWNNTGSKFGSYQEAEAKAIKWDMEDMRSCHRIYIREGNQDWRPIRQEERV